jgi:hypothetical protein
MFFWRKQKAAIAGFHPLHQALIHERVFTATQPAAGWVELTTSLNRHSGLVTRRKWALPPRVLEVIVPLVAEICTDLNRNGALTIAADLRGHEAPGKSHPPRDLPVRPPVRSATDIWSIDPWLRLRADLRDGSVLEILVVDRIRTRKVTKRNPRGKIKIKSKTKQVQIIKVRRKLPPGVPGRQPATAPPRWIQTVVRDGPRRSVTAAAKITRKPQSHHEQVDWILAVATEPFRWSVR